MKNGKHSVDLDETSHLDLPCLQRYLDERVSFFNTATPTREDYVQELHHS